jgi:hypothetical protein
MHPQGKGMPKGSECQKRPADVIGKDGGEAKPVHKP